MEQPSANTEGQQQSPSGEPRNGQERRGRNRNRNRSRSRNRDRSEQPRDEQAAAVDDDLEFEDIDTSFIGAEDDDTDDSPPPQPTPVARNPQPDASARQPRSERTRPERSERTDRSERAERPERTERTTPNSQRQTSERQERTSERPERAQQERQPRAERTRPERGERADRSERTELTDRTERPLFERRERSETPAQPQPERQERYEPMDIERHAGASVFEGDEDLDGGRRSGERTPLSEDAQRERLVIGITLGDYNGVGPEVILKALQYNQLQKICTPVIYGSMRVLNRYRNLLNLKDWNLNGIQQVEQASHKMTNVITCFSENTPPAANAVLPDNSENEPTDEAPAPIVEKPAPVAAAVPAAVPIDIQPGKVTPEAGTAAFACLSRAVDDLRAGKIHALVTAPINKHNIQSDAFKFPGHTEYLASAFGVSDNLMFMVSDTLRVGVVTGHVPLGRVRQGIHKNAILQKLDLMTRSLKQDFGIRRPRIAVLGLNPHAGENGLLGNEEKEVIAPLINELRQKGQLVYGPFPADGFFGTRAYRKYDAVLAMYHDQGLIPFKSIAFEEGVNFTAGMPAVRTSPDHGTAYDIAGKGVADETSMIQAIYTACDAARRRLDYQQLEANALKK